MPSQAKNNYPVNLWIRFRVQQEFTQRIVDGEIHISSAMSRQSGHLAEISCKESGAVYI